LPRGPTGGPADRFGVAAWVSASRHDPPAAIVAAGLLRSHRPAQPNRRSMLRRVGLTDASNGFPPICVGCNEPGLFPRALSGQRNTWFVADGVLGDREKLGHIDQRFEMHCDEHGPRAPHCLGQFCGAAPQLSATSRDRTLTLKLLAGLVGLFRDPGRDRVAALAEWLSERPARDHAGADKPPAPPAAAPVPPAPLTHGRQVPRQGGHAQRAHGKGRGPGKRPPGFWSRQGH
jgi:hypothetical protein